MTGVGDINGDGIDDLLIGDPSEKTGHLFLSSTLSSLPAGTDLAPSLADYTLDISMPTTVGMQSGVGLGDWDGDGLDDFVVSDGYAKTPKKGAAITTGAAYIFLGNVFNEANKGQTLGTDQASYTLEGGQLYEYMGQVNMLQNAGDVDGDGLQDLLLGSKDNSEGGKQNGKVYLVYAKKVLSHPPETQLDLAYDSDGFVFKQYDIMEFNQLSALSSAGDTNNDGKADLLLSSGGANEQNGRVYIIDSPF